MVGLGLGSVVVKRGLGSVGGRNALVYLVGAPNIGAGSGTGGADARAI